MKIYKFGKIPTGSVQGMKGMLRLIDNSIPQIIVLSATTETTERLAGIAAHLFNRDTEQAHDEISRLEFRFIDFANELFNDESIKQQAADSIIDRFPPTFYICRRERHTGAGRIYQQYASQPLSERAGNQQPTTQQPRLHATGSGRRTGHGIHRYKATLALGRA